MDHLRQATCSILGVMLNFDATQHFAAQRRTQQACRSYKQEAVLKATAVRSPLRRR